MTATQTRSRHDDARRAMLDSQLRTSGINEQFVLERMGSVAREEYVPDGARGTAYMDRAIRLPDGGFLPAPLFHGMLLAEAKPRVEDTVLIVSGGTDYLAELVRPLVGSVEVVDAVAGANGKAKTKEATLLLIDGAVEGLPEKLVRRVADDGRVVTGLIERGVTRLAAGRKVADTLALVPLAETGIPRLGAFDRPAGWSF